MKIQFASDLHLELIRPSGARCAHPTEALAYTDADVLILAGDIDLGAHGVEWAASRQPGCPQEVIYVPGNHEFYGQEHDSALEEMGEVGDRLGVVVLDNQARIIQGVRFLGATLWTGFDAHGIENREIAMRMAEFGGGPHNGRMADYYRIRVGDRKLSATDTLGFHRTSVAWLRGELEKAHDGPTVVVTHHAPSIEAVPLRFRDDPLTPAFWSPLEDLVGTADLWICGHTHLTVDTCINGCRLLSNPRGYEGWKGVEVKSYRPAWVVDMEREPEPRHQRNVPGGTPNR